MIRSSIDFAISEVFAFFFREFQCLKRFHVALFLYDLLWAITVRCECCSLTWKLFHQLLCAFKLLANLPTSGDNLVDTIFDGMQEQSRLKRTDEPRGFTEVDNHEAVKIGDLKNSEAIEVVKSKVNKEIYQSAAVREGADELTLREGDALLHQHRQCGSQQMGGHHQLTKIGTQFVKPSTKGVEGAEWEKNFQVCGDEQGSQCSKPKWDAAG